MSILAVQNLMQWEKLLEKARRVWFNRKWKQVVVYVRKTARERKSRCKSVLLLSQWQVRGVKGARPPKMSFELKQKSMSFS